MKRSERSDSDKGASLLCPSYVCKPGAQLIGIVGADGCVQYLRQPITINATFVETARKGRIPEQRFRFSGKCIQNGCHQWNADKQICALADRLIEQINNPVSSTLPDCPIRSRCRWFSQRGELACAQCNEVVRNQEIAYVETVQ